MRLYRPYLSGGCLYPDALFRIKTTEKLLCLTFDDGPHPESTPLLLEILELHGIKALFFCNGRAAEQYSDLVGIIKSNGHLIGNHGYNHPDGWRTSAEKYIKDVSDASCFTSSSLFRPPYGRLRLSQYRMLRTNFKIVFWDIMPYDFDKSFGAENSYKVLTDKLRPGSIIVLHDQPKSTLLIFLNRFIEYAVGRGYRFVLPVSIQ